MNYAFVVLAAIFLGIFCRFRDDNGSAKALLFKTCTSVLFVLVAVFSITEQSVFFALTVSGLLFGLIGDIMLDLKFVDKANAVLYTFAGMCAFAIGHLFYIGAVIFFFDLEFIDVLISALAAIVGAVAVIITTLKVMKYNYEKYLSAAAVYSFLLIFFTALTICALIKGESLESAWLLSIGSVCFLVSDVVLSMMYFGGKKGKSYIVINHVLYYAAQFLIAFAVSAIG
ncbi:MAG: lysoplasmalogenase [Clostridiales bacterium]|nr:lysoplasmalogenase [Clostridiales bacterium]